MWQTQRIISMLDDNLNMQDGRMKMELNKCSGPTLYCEWPLYILYIINIYLYNLPKDSFSLAKLMRLHRGSIYHN